MLEWECFVFEKNFWNRNKNWSFKYRNLEMNIVCNDFVVPVNIPGLVKHSSVWEWSSLHMVPDPFRGALTIILWKKVDSKQSNNIYNVRVRVRVTLTEAGIL